MKGSIRTFIGFLLVFGSVGGMDNSTDPQLLVLLATSVLGLFMMYSGVRALEKL